MVGHAGGRSGRWADRRVGGKAGGRSGRWADRQLGGKAKGRSGGWSDKWVGGQAGGRSGGWAVRLVGGRPRVQADFGSYIHVLRYKTLKTSTKLVLWMTRKQQNKSVTNFKSL